VKALETTFLAGGAALSLLAGAATAQFGLHPLNAALARQAAGAPAIDLDHPVFSADQPPMQVADYRVEPSALYSDDAKRADGDPEPKAREVSDATPPEADESAPSDEGRERADSPAEVTSAIVLATTPTGYEFGAVGDPPGDEVAATRARDVTAGPDPE